MQRSFRLRLKRCGENRRRPHSTELQVAGSNKLLAQSHNHVTNRLERSVELCRITREEVLARRLSRVEVRGTGIIGHPHQNG